MNYVQSIYVVVMSASTHIRGGQDKLVVYDPFWRRVETTGQVQAHHLVILDGEVAPLFTFLVRHLHEKAADQSLSDVVPVVLVLPRSADELEVVLLHAPL